MPSARLSVILTRRLPDVIEKRMGDLFDVRLRDSDIPMTRTELAQAMRSADVLVPTLSDRLDAEMMTETRGRLRLIANYGSGVDHIDLLSARKNGIIVTNTPGASAVDTADMTMALILGVSRRLPEGMDVLQSGQWQGWSPTALLGRRLSRLGLGILGMGRIGQAVARRASAFGMVIHYHNRNRLHPQTEAELSATYWESLDQMVANMDIISIHSRHTPSTYHLMNARRLKLMKPGAIIVNTSRGEVIDENALTRLLRTGEIAGAGLDVYERGTEINPRLKSLKNVVLLPHMGSATVEARIEMGERVLLNIKTFEDGHRLPDQVLPAML